MAKKGIIYETLNEVKSMNMQKSGDGFMHLSGVFGVCGVRNNNQRVYETSNYAKMVESMQARLKKAPIPGELEHPQSMTICTENISHRIDSISIDENGVVSGEITLLNTPKGKIAQALVEGGLPLFISSRAQGQVDKNGNVTLEMLQTYDLVGSPGFSQAELHLNEGQCFESINENMFFISEGADEEVKKTDKNLNENNTEDMDNEKLKELLERFEDLESQVEYLTEQNTMLQDQIDEHENINLEELAEGIQSWLLEEYSPTLQEWIVEEYSQKVQNWVVENYSQEVQNWVVEHFAPEIQNWVTEKYSEKLQDWVVEEFAPEIQKWIVEDYSPTLQNWITEHYEPSLKNSINESIKESIKESKSDKFGMIDGILEMLDNKKVEKPVYGRKAAMLTEASVNLPKYITEMPADVKVKYDLASEEIKESISRKAKLYDWSKPNAIVNFWESIDFNANVNVNTVFEDLNNITNEKERMLRESIRRWRNR